ncbi:nucleotidyltransferase domain-containing protein [Paracraurococcus lichenis]|uniref:Nucleotidyltransferase domain-containing protein n=1 Tax=Paracraurococcus lichenis TaxID=3064888 RepID=A0ABT9E2X4_9PROT|nr:nucleotidyltransferase domain-containing protein [Paracraurococcus sp. LOR1-02]MDO9710512.1 nucleotidyltransferase domain-containing protein [Paracraurococcus sp. LOR1-02]
MTPPVRLLPEEIAAVKRIVAEHFGPAAEVRVFGSRARLEARGGDLDLHVLVPGRAPAESVADRVAMAIEHALDDRHTDLLVLGREDTARRIDEVALQTGVLI